MLSYDERKMLDKIIKDSNDKEKEPHEYLLKNLNSILTDFFKENSKYISNISKGAEVNVKSIDTNQSFTGEVSRINAKVNSQTQSVEVYIRIKDKNLKEGMYMEAQIEAMEFNNVFALDRGLINGSKELFAVRENKLISLKINPIHYTETQAIVEGLVDGEEIISQPIIGAYNGMEINPVDKQPN